MTHHETKTDAEAIEYIKRVRSECVIGSDQLITQPSRAFILLDTNNKNTTMSTNTKPSWLVTHSSKTTGSVYLDPRVHRIKAMRIYPTTTNFIVPSAPYEYGELTKIYSGTRLNMNYNITVLIHELQAQSYVGRDGRKFHFVLYPQLMNPSNQHDNEPPVTPDNPYFELLTSGKMNGWYYFKESMPCPSSLTVSMGCPFELLRIGTDTSTNRILVPLELVYDSYSVTS